MFMPQMLCNLLTQQSPVFDFFLELQKQSKCQALGRLQNMGFWT